MFTGIVSGVGRIVAVAPLGAGAAFGKRAAIDAAGLPRRRRASATASRIQGACMTVGRLEPGRRFQVEISAESLGKTTGLDPPAPVNLEKAMRANDRLGGHLVSGHVDGVAEVSRFEPVGESWELEVAAPRRPGSLSRAQGLGHGRWRQPHRQQR